MKKKKTKQLSYPIENLLYFASKGTPPPRLVTPDDFKKRKKFPNDPKWDQSKVPEAVAKIRKIFDSLIEKKKLIDSEELQYFTDIALQYTTKYKVSEGRLIDFLEPTRKNALLYFVKPDWLRDLSYSLIEFLKDPEIIKSLRKCPQCQKYFIASRIDQAYCLRSCYSRTYHRQDMRERRDPQSPKYDQKYKTREFG
jgi:hypothetical protein